MIKNTYLYPEDLKKSGLPMLTQEQISLIEGICNEADELEAKDSEPYVAPYRISDVLRKTPVYLASKEMRERISKQRQELVKKMTDRFLQRIETIADEESRKNLLIHQESICQTNDEPLGWYDPAAKKAFICLEAIIEESESSGLSLDSIIVAVTIHELAHALMSNGTCYDDVYGYWLEKSLANKVMLNCTNHWEEGFDDILEFVRNQPDAYRASEVLYEYKNGNWQMLKRFKHRINPAYCEQWILMLLDILRWWDGLDTMLHILFVRCFDIPSSGLTVPQRDAKPKVLDFSIPFAELHASKPEEYKINVGESILFCKIHTALQQTGYSLSPSSVYQCAKGAWLIKETPQYVVALDRGVVVGAFCVDHWQDVIVTGATGKPQKRKVFTAKPETNLTDHERNVLTVLSSLQYIKLSDKLFKGIRQTVFACRTNG